MESFNCHSFLRRLFVVFLAVFSASLGHAKTSWNGTTSTNWGDAVNWTAGVQISTVDAFIVDANFTGLNQPAITTVATCNSLTLGTAAKLSTLTVSNVLTVSGNITIGTNGKLS